VIAQTRSDASGATEASAGSGLHNYKAAALPIGCPIPLTAGTF
jgi:hypothetical protein